MIKNPLRFRRTLCMLALPTLIATAANAAGTVEITFNNGWVTGSVSGMAPPWPFGFTLEGSFAAQSSATIVFGDDGVPTLTVAPVDPPSSQRFVIEFPVGAAAPSIGVSSGPYRSPLLQTFDSGGKVVLSVWANGATGPSILGGASLIPTAVPEPASALLLLGGLGVLPLLARRRRMSRDLPDHEHTQAALAPVAKLAGPRACL